MSVTNTKKLILNYRPTDTVDLLIPFRENAPFLGGVTSSRAKVGMV
jgi:hypothetical protein